MVLIENHRLLIASIILQIFVSQLTIKIAVASIMRNEKWNFDKYRGYSDISRMRKIPTDIKIVNVTIKPTTTIPSSTIETVSTSAIETVSTSAIETVSTSAIETVSTTAIETVSTSAIETTAKLSLKTNLKKCDEDNATALASDRMCNHSLSTNVNSSSATTEGLLHQLREKVEDVIVDELESVFNDSSTIKNRDRSDNSTITTTDVYTETSPSDYDDVTMETVKNVSKHFYDSSQKNTTLTVKKMQTISDVSNINIDYYDKTTGVRYVSLIWKSGVVLLLVCVITAWLFTLITDKYRKKNKTDTSSEIHYPLEDVCDDPSSHLCFPSLDTSKTYHIIKENDSSHYDTPRPVQSIYEEVILRD